MNQRQLSKSHHFNGSCGCCATWAFNIQATEAASFLYLLELLPHSLKQSHVWKAPSSGSQGLCEWSQSWGMWVYLHNVTILTVDGLMSPSKEVESCRMCEDTIQCRKRVYRLVSPPQGHPWRGECTCKALWSTGWVYDYCEWLTQTLPGVWGHQGQAWRAYTSKTE